MYNTIEVPEQFKYVLDRGWFEHTKACSNVSFLLSQHSEDKNTDVLDSMLFKQLLDRAVDAGIQNANLQLGTIVNMFNENVEDENLHIPMNYRFQDENRICVYNDTMEEIR